MMLIKFYINKVKKIKTLIITFYLSVMTIIKKTIKEYFQQR